MTPAELGLQQELEREIVHYVRSVQRLTPVRSEHVANFMRHVRRVTLPADRIQDRIDYLVSRGYLESATAWAAGEGEVTTYRATAAGMNALDGRTSW